MLRLIVNDEAALRQSCAPVGIREGRRLARQLIAWLEGYNRRAHREGRVLGAGVAAPQLGIPKRVAVLLLGATPLALVNPVVVSASTETFSHTEGCLSFPGRSALVRRPVWLRVLSCGAPTLYAFGVEPGQDATPVSLFRAALAAHEIDHCNGRLFFDQEEQAARDAAVDARASTLTAVNVTR